MAFYSVLFRTFDEQLGMPTEGHVDALMTVLDVLDRRRARLWEVITLKPFFDLVNARFILILLQVLYNPRGEFLFIVSISLFTEEIGQSLRVQMHGGWQAH